MRIVFILLLLFSCMRQPEEQGTVYEVRHHTIKECQTLNDPIKKTNYQHCRDSLYFDCGYVKYAVFKTLKVFKKFQNANKYCETLRDGKKELVVNTGGGTK